MQELRYPIGRFEHVGPVSEAHLTEWIDQIEQLPLQVREAVTHLDDDQLDTPYRPDGWTLRQVAHHLPDSHLNAYIRFKWALTEEEPTIKPYDEARWAETADYGSPVEPALDLLTLLHGRWVCLLRSLSREDFARHFLHPESGRIELAWNVGLYAWHGRHHLAHITQTVERSGWQTSP